MFQFLFYYFLVVLKFELRASKLELKTFSTVPGLFLEMKLANFLSGL
jgi:hypothetical protein